MLFNSYAFFLFFAVTLLSYFCTSSWKARKYVLLIASYLFYAVWNPPFILLIWVSTIIDWLVARKLHNTESTNRRRLLLIASLSTNLGLLGYFKYGSFLLDSFAYLASELGIGLTFPSSNIVLPVGISFYTFQTLSYTIDVYRRKLEPSNSLLDFALYVTFFPQLVAGPIVRAADFLPQCRNKRAFDERQFGWGIAMLVFGLFQKSVIADGLLAPIADKAFSIQIPDFGTAWFGTVAFAGQILCDFSGYSTCAIGIAMCFGFSLPDNFRFPYSARGFSDFWQRWHISLSTWLRDYLYIPLGGNRSGTIHTMRNLMITMVLGGLWHGAAWTFVAWGFLHGMLLVIERCIKSTPIARHAFWQQPIGKIIVTLATFVAICFTWTLFRSRSFSQAWSFFIAMCGFSASQASANAISGLDTAIAISVTGVILGLHWYFREHTIESFVDRLPSPAIAVLGAFMLLAIWTNTGQDNAFIYFQF